MLAVLVNCIAVIIGSVFGILFSSRFSDKISDTIQTGAGVVVLVLGVQMAFQFQNIIYFTLAILLGGIIGTIIDLDDKIFRFGKAIEKIVPRQKDGGKNNFAYAFLNASVLFCVGAMTILGSIKAGIEKDYSIIFTKSILDGFMAISFTAAMGIGTAFSALTIFAYQGALTILSAILEPYCTDQMIRELTGCGGAMICMVGINLLGLKKIKTANYLPAVIFTVIFVLLDPIFKSVAN